MMAAIAIVGERYEICFQWSIIFFCGRISQHIERGLQIFSFFWTDELEYSESEMGIWNEGKWNITPRSSFQFRIKTACWVGDCFVYTTTSNRLNFFVGGQVNTVAVLDKLVLSFFSFFLIFLQKQNNNKRSCPEHFTSLDTFHVMIASTLSTKI